MDKEVSYWLHLCKWSQQSDLHNWETTFSRYIKHMLLYLHKKTCTSNHSEVCLNNRTRLTKNTYIQVRMYTYVTSFFTSYDILFDGLSAHSFKI